MDKEHAQELRDVAETTIPVGSRWRHYKGGIYVVLEVSCLEENPDLILVTYRSEERGSRWTRTLGNWLDTWQAAGSRVARFERVDAPAEPASCARCGGRVHVFGDGPLATLCEECDRPTEDRSSVG